MFLILGIFLKNKYESIEAKQKSNVVFVANHLSYLDAIVVTASINKIFRPLGKEGIATIPLIGIMYRQFVIMVRRSSMSSKIESLKEMQQTLDAGYAVLLFPEGTFYSKVTAILNPFKDGAFHLAIEKKVDIQPLIILYSKNRLHPKSALSINPGRIVVYYMNPISTKNYTTAHTAILKNIVFNKMKTKLEEFKYPILDI